MNRNGTPHETTWTGRPQPDRRRGAARIRDRIAERRVRLRHPDEAELLLLPGERHRHGADAEAEHEALALRVDDAGSRESERAADRRMAGHRQLFRGREDAHPHVGATLLRGQHERRLREVHLLGDRLHRVGRQPAAVEEDGELIAAEEMIGEDVEMDVTI